MKLPKVDEVRKKARAIDGAKNVTLKEEDIEQVGMESDSFCWMLFMCFVLICSDQIIQEKQKYRKNPRNYAMTKSRVIREKASLMEM